MGMKENYESAAQGQAAIERSVRSVLQRAGVPSFSNHFYMDFAKKIVKLSKTHSRDTLCTEVGIELGKWSGRGLLPGVLEEIRDAFVRCPAIPPGQPFRCDISLFDGPDYLS